MRRLKASVIYGFILSALIVLGINTIAWTQTVAPPPAIPSGYVPLPEVNSLIAEHSDIFRHRIPETYVSNDFTSQEKKWVTPAVRGYISTFSNYTPSMNCILKNAKSFEARSNWFNAWPESVRPNQGERLKGVIQSPGLAVYRSWQGHRLTRTEVPMRLFIERVSDSNLDWTGLANVGTDLRTEGYRIKLNMAKFSILSDTDADSFKKMGAVIFHEMLHNVGYEHGEVIKDDFSRVEGSVPYVAQWCFVSFGEHGSAKSLLAAGGSWLTDPSSPRKDPGIYAD